MKWIIFIVLAVVAGAVVWDQRNSEFLRPWMRMEVVRFSPAADDKATTGKRTPTIEANVNYAAKEGVRKCLRNGEVSYTNGACPPGSTPQKVTGGEVTVMSVEQMTVDSDSPKPSKQSSAPIARPNLHDYFLPPDAVDVKAKMADRVVRP